MKHFILMLAAAFSFAVADARGCCRTTPSCKPRILISTDIGGTDADDNQSIPEFNGLKGLIVAGGEWPGRHQTATDLPLGDRWFTDKADKALFNGPWQGFHSIARWREDVLRDWAVRWEWAVRWGWLKDNPIKTKEKSIKTNEK